MTRADRVKDGATAARNRMLPEGRLVGPMPWIIGVMMFLTILAAGAGLALGSAVRTMSDDLTGRLTVQIVEADPKARIILTDQVVEALKKDRRIQWVKPVPPDSMADQLRPWLGDEAINSDLPIPALVDAALRPGVDSSAIVAQLRVTMKRLSPTIGIEPHADFLQPLTSLLTIMGWSAAGLVVLMAMATGAVVVLAARGAHDGHRSTIEVLHLMGATDLQIARLFQRRIAFDALLGCVAGFGAGAIVIFVIGAQLVLTGSEWLGAIGLPKQAWLVLIALPIAGSLLAMVAARFTVLRALRRTL